MNNFIFTIRWKKDFDKIDSVNKTRILNKLRFLKEVSDLWLYFKKLENFYPATHRLRVWDLRIILEKVDNNNFKILNIWNRGDIYK
jgi:mRNA-degrading endonuclease RelE of RelBE toxin-antitoxin system